MKFSAQILLLLALCSLLALSFSAKVTVTKSFHTSKSFHSSSNSNSNGGGNSGSGGSDNGGGSDNEEETETPPINPGADSFNACDPNNRPEVCTLEYAPVCGYIHECEGGSCTSTFGNDCTACANSNVDGYVNGACEDVQTTCDPDNRPEVCTAIYTATCAVAANCEGSHCFQDTSSSCVACSMEGVAYSLPGVCPGDNDNSDREYCDPNNRPEVCTLEYNPVCAHTSNCVGEDCWSTAGNSCSACANENVDYWYPGECSDDDDNGGDGDGDDNGRTECDVNNRPEVCTLEYAPVCAHIIGCEGDGDECFRTEGNGCGACSLDDVDYYTQGEC